MLDGLGYVGLNRVLKGNTFLQNHICAEVTSVFPSSTAIAMTSYYSGKSPMELGWLGTGMYMKEYATDVHAFTGKTRHAKTPVDGPMPPHYLMPYETVFLQLKRSNRALQTNSIFAIDSYAENDVDAKWHSEDFPQMCACILEIAAGDLPSYTLAYWHEPDFTLHRNPFDSADVLAQYTLLNNELKQLSSQPEGTLLIVASDHGLIEYEKRFDLSGIPELMHMLVMPFMLESRATFYVKPHRHADFEQFFKEHFSDDFILLSREEVYRSGIFARGIPHRKFDDYIGDYIACAIGKAMFTYSLPCTKAKQLLGMHGGLTEDEMRVAVMLYRV